MSNRIPWMVCLAVAILLWLSGNVVAATSKQVGPSLPSAFDVDPHSPASVQSVTASAPVLPAEVGMSDLMSQAFEFTGDFPAGWQTYSAISQTISGTVMGDYFWSTTAYTSAQGARSAIALQGGVNGSVLTDTATFTDPVDSWLVYGPVSLSSVWQAELDWKYLYHTPLSSTANFTVAVSTDYDPISRTGTFDGQALSGTLAGWTLGTLDLSSYAGEDVYVAFHYQSSAGGAVSDGPFVDDVHLRANYSVFLPIIMKWMLTLSKSAPSNVWPGHSLVYAITVNNLDGAQSAYPVTVMDTVPANTTFAGADGAYDFSNGVVTWSGLTVPAGGSVTQHVTVTVASTVTFGTPIVNSQYSVSSPPNPTILYGSPVTTSIVSSFYDNFTDPSSGWPIGDFTPSAVSCWPPPGSWRANYLSGGGYGVATACDRAAQLYPAPVRLGDTRYFTVEADMRSTQSDLWYSSYGLFFNGIDDLHEVYTFEFYQGMNPPEWDIRYWSNFNWSDKITPPADILYYDTCWSCDGNDFAWNHALIRRKGDVIEVWLGPGTGRSHLTRVATIQDSRASSSLYNRIGFIHSNFEWNFQSSSPGQYAYSFNNFLASPVFR